MNFIALLRIRTRNLNNIHLFAQVTPLVFSYNFTKEVTLKKTFGIIS